VSPTRSIRAALLLFLASGLLTAGWAWRVSRPSGARVVKFAYVGSVDDPRHLSALHFKERLEAASHDSIRVELYYGAQLGGDRDAIEGVRLGTIEMTVAGAGVFATFEPRMGVTALPYLFDDFEDAWSFIDGPVNRAVEDLLTRRGIRVVAHWENGFRSITTADRPVRTPADLRGLKIRTPENPILLATLRALGANPNPLPWPEVYMALQQGAFDGEENPVPVIHAARLYEVQKYLSLTRHVYEPMPLVVSEIFWQGLSDRERELIRDAALDSQRFNRALVTRQAREEIADLRAKGMTVIQPDLAPFRAATAGVRRLFDATLGPDLVRAAYEHATPTSPAR
jgi:tripartite ATP-independent transporter DctP family solute receptor